MEPINIVLILYCISVCIVFLITPKWGFLFFFSTKFTIDLLWDHTIIWKISVLKIIGVVFPLLCFVYVLREHPPVFKSPLFKIIALIFILNVLSSIWGYLNGLYAFIPIPHTPVSMYRILEWNFRFLNIAGILLVTPFILREAQDIILFFRAFLFSTVVPFTLSWYQFSAISINHMMMQTGEPYSVLLFQRLNATYHDSGTLSIVLFTAIILSILLKFIDSSKSLRIIYFIYSILCSIMLYFTFSRTLWISLTVFLLLFFYLQKKYRYVSVVLVMGVCIFAFIPLTQKRFERELKWISNGHRITSYEDIEKLGTGRIWLWNDAKKHYLNLDWVSKIIGSGGSFGSHNQYIAWLLRNGLLGVTVWVFFLYKIAILLRYKNQIHNKNTYGAFVLCVFFTIIIITNMRAQPLDNVTFGYFFWGMIGLYLTDNNKAGHTHNTIIE